MPVRITPTKSLLISYDAQTDSWVTLDGLSLCVLNQYVDIEPGTTVEHLFNLIDSDKETKHFLSEFCSCDIDKLRAEPPRLKASLTVYAGTKTLPDGSLVFDGETDAKELHICPYFFTFDDKETGERHLTGGNMLMARSPLEGSCGCTFGNSVTFADIKHLEIRLDHRLWIDECDGDEDGNEDDCFSALIRYTLLDVFVAVLGHFGTPAFDRRYQPEIDEDLRIRDHLRRKFGVDSDGEPESNGIP